MAICERCKQLTLTITSFGCAKIFGLKQHLLTGQHVLSCPSYLPQSPYTHLDADTQLAGGGGELELRCDLARPWR